MLIWKKQKLGITFVELIVVITILLILWIIAFISFQWFAKDARDARRLNNTKSLLSKINSEEIKWVFLDSMISSYKDWENLKENFLVFNSQTWKIWYQWKVNFKNLWEIEENFQDPKTSDNYPFAISKWAIELNWKTEIYSFHQIAYVSERDWKTKLIWNYFKYKDGDSPSLFTLEWTNGINIPWDYYINNDIDKIYDIWTITTSTPTDCEWWYYLPDWRKRCVEVWIWYYSWDWELSRTKCEWNKTTLTMTSSTIDACNVCKKWYVWVNCDVEAPDWLIIAESTTMPCAENEPDIIATIDWKLLRIAWCDASWTWYLVWTWSQWTNWSPRYIYTETSWEITWIPWKLHYYYQRKNASDWCESKWRRLPTKEEYIGMRLTFWWTKLKKDWLLYTAIQTWYPYNFYPAGYRKNWLNELSGTGSVWHYWANPTPEDKRYLNYFNQSSYSVSNGTVWSWNDSNLARCVKDE